MKTKGKSRFRVMTRNILLFMAAVLLLWFFFHKGMTVYEHQKYPPTGQLVEVDGKKMHIYTKGEGENTILLMSGLGTAAPVLDFEPLINELAKNNRVAVVEAFGYGWSDATNKERTVENIVGEIRSVLNQSNIEGPFILMPHSISGLYSMYYANKYPSEVKAVIGIDPTLPKALEYFHEAAPLMPNYWSYVAPTGIARLAVYLMADNFLPIAEEGTYSEENLDMTKAISAWKGNNRNVVQEGNEIKQNIEKTVHMSFPSNMPVLFFTTKEDKVNEEGKSNVTFYQTQLTNHPSSEVVILKGHHYLHWTQAKTISNHVNDFTTTFENE
ncbi:alpha/beta hydrolase [Niallia oryzisoli]|uniref:Alpha/beta hydrolase n=1 Tax=Niallia oryzisoli TaxID=1737571 RepID=A0ABZ2C7Z5_9BACI